jgi:hypothetical protein
VNARHTKKGVKLDLVQKENMLNQGMLYDDEGLMSMTKYAKCASTRYGNAYVHDWSNEGRRRIHDHLALYVPHLISKWLAEI